MRQYSFSAIPTRLAREGEELVTHTFPDGSTGFVASENVQQDYRPRRMLRTSRGIGRILNKILRISSWTESVSAIYVPFGSRLILKNIPAEMQQKCGVQWEEGVIFSHVNKLPDSYRDGLDFSNGSQIYLRDLPEGAPLEVLSLASTDLPSCQENFGIHAQI
jgi:hypothetical protein